MKSRPLPYEQLLDHVFHLLAPLKMNGTKRPVKKEEIMKATQKVLKLICGGFLISSLLFAIGCSQT